MTDPMFVSLSLMLRPFAAFADAALLPGDLVGLGLRLHAFLAAAADCSRFFGA